NELMLGFIETRHGPRTRGWGVMSTEEQKAIFDHTLLQRTGRVEEVAKMVSFLVFDASFMTGSTIRMDGGYIIGGDKAASMPKGVVEPGEPTYGGYVPPKTAVKKTRNKS
ncbi:MAG: SDR family oxidoreductase, partial [Deltaproteobacteria bacterium]